MLPNSETWFTLKSPVVEIERFEGAVRVRTTNGQTTTRKVVVAMSPADALRIKFSPPLAAPRQELNRVWAGGTGAKVHAVYPTAFWRGAGFSGQALSGGFVGLTYDNSPASGTPGTLVGFVADEATMPRDRELRRKLTLESFCRTLRRSRAVAARLRRVRLESGSVGSELRVVICRPVH